MDTEALSAVELARSGIESGDGRFLVTFRPCCPSDRAYFLELAARRCLEFEEANGYIFWREEGTPDPPKSRQISCHAAKKIRRARKKAGVKPYIYRVYFRLAGFMPSTAWDDRWRSVDFEDEERRSLYVKQNCSGWYRYGYDEGWMVPHKAGKRWDDGPPKDLELRDPITGLIVIRTKARVASRKERHDAMG